MKVVLLLTMLVTLGGCAGGYYATGPSYAYYPPSVYYRPPPVYYGWGGGWYRPRYGYAPGWGHHHWH